jgi:hypothetical protein
MSLKPCGVKDSIVRMVFLDLDSSGLSTPFLEFLLVFERVAGSQLCLVLYEVHARSMVYTDGTADVFIF